MHQEHAPSEAMNDHSSPPKPRYDIDVKLTGGDGNAFALLGQVRRALQKAGAPPEEYDKFFKEATAGDYDELLATCMEWVNVQ
jgi:hypothetical protein